MARLWGGSSQGSTYVFSLHERRQHLIDSGTERRGRKRKHSGDGENVDEPAANNDEEAVADAVLRLKLAKILQQQAIATVTEDKKPGGWC